MAMPSNAAQSAHPSRALSQAHSNPSGAAVLSRPAAAPLKVDITTLRPDGSLLFSQAMVPAAPAMIAAFSAFARGTVLRTPTQEIAIEDLTPGDMLWTASGVPARVMWIGSTVFEARTARQSNRLYRVMPDTFGPARPERFVTLGAGARILHSPVHLRDKHSGTPLLTPVRDFVDSEGVIEVAPPTPQHLFHLVTDRHAVIRAGGLETESFHPGLDTLRSMPPNLRDRFLALFPHLQTIGDFGPLAQSRAPELRVA